MSAGEAGSRKEARVSLHAGPAMEHPDEIDKMVFVDSLADALSRLDKHVVVDSCEALSFSCWNRGGRPVREEVRHLGRLKALKHLRFLGGGAIDVAAVARSCEELRTLTFDNGSLPLLEETADVLGHQHLQSICIGGSIERCDGPTHTSLQEVERERPGLCFFREMEMDTVRKSRESSSVPGRDKRFSRLLFGNPRKSQMEPFFSLEETEDYCKLWITKDAVVSALKRFGSIMCACKEAAFILRALDRGISAPCFLPKSASAIVPEHPEDLEHLWYVFPATSSKDPLFELGDDVGQFWYKDQEGKFHGLVEDGVVTLDSMLQVLEFQYAYLCETHPAGITACITYFSVVNCVTGAKVFMDLPDLNRDLYRDAQGNLIAWEVDSYSSEL